MLRCQLAAWATLGLVVGGIPTDALAHASTRDSLTDAGGKKKKGGKKKGGKKKKGGEKKQAEPSAPALLDPTGASPAAEATAHEGDAEASPDPAPETTTPAADAAPSDGTPMSVAGPVEFRGKLSKGSRKALGRRFRTAAGSTSVPTVASLRLKVAASRKRSYALTLTVLDEGGATLAEHHDECSDCSLDDAGQRIEALVGTAAAALQPAPPPAEEPGSGTVTVRSVPLGAMVTVDGKEHGPTPQTLELTPGEHTITLSKPGFEAQAQTLKVEADAEQSLEPTLVATAAAAPQGDPAGAKPYTISGAVMLGLGVAGVATGVALILIDEDPMPFKCPDESIDFRGTCRHRYDTLLGGIIGVAAGGLGVGGGIALLIKGHQVKVRGKASATQATMGVSLRF